MVWVFKDSDISSVELSVGERKTLGMKDIESFKHASTLPKFGLFEACLIYCEIGVFIQKNILLHTLVS